jgi:putative transposase
VIDQAIVELTPLVGVRGGCAAVGEAQARWYRRHRQSPPPPRPERVPALQPRALSEVERKELRRVLNSPEFVDEAPATVYAKLLDQGIYLASVPTMYRVLRAHDEVHERRRQASHPAAKKPELLATKPNVCWSWDITKLLGPAKWTYYYLYVIIDIFSRYVPGWMLAHAENARLAERLRRRAAQRVDPQGSSSAPSTDQARRERAYGGTSVCARAPWPVEVLHEQAVLLHLRVA